MSLYELNSEKIEYLIDEMYKKFNNLQNENYENYEKNILKQEHFTEGLNYLLVKYLLEIYKDKDVKKRRGRPSKIDKLKNYKKKEVKIEETEDIKWEIILENEKRECKKIHIVREELKVLICEIDSKKKEKYEYLIFDVNSDISFYLENYIVDCYKKEFYIMTF